MDVGIIVVFVGIVATLGCVGFALHAALSGPQRQMQRRAETVRMRLTYGVNAKTVQAANKSVKRVEATSMPFLDRFIKRIMPRQALLKSRLARTGYNIAFGTYILVNIAFALVAILVAHLITGLPLVLSLLISVIAGIGLPHLAIGRLAQRRNNRFIAIFPDAIDLIVRGLKSGLPVTESIGAVGKEMADPVGYEFRTIADSLKFGKPLEQALWETATRLDLQEFKFFVISLSVQRETGGNLGETLANLSDILRRRRQMRLKIKAMSSEARASAYILGSLPFIMFGIIFMLNPGYEMELFTDPRGKMMLGAGPSPAATASDLPEGG